MKLNINKEIETFITEEHKEEIKSLLSNLNEYRNVKPEHTLNYVIQYIRELITEGNESQSTSILSGCDESDFYILDRLNRLEEDTNEEDTNNLIKYINHYKDNEVYNMFNPEFIENEFLTEDLTEIFNLNNLYEEKNIFTYCSSHSGNLYFNSPYIDKLDLTEFDTIEELNDLLFEYNIKELFAVFVYDNYINDFIMSIDSKEMTKQEDDTLKAVKEELKKRFSDLTINIQELEEEFDKLSISSPICFNIIKTEQNRLEQELREVEEVLKWIKKI